MSNQKLGTEKTEALAEALKKLVIVGKKVSADKKLNMEDLPAFFTLIPELPSLAEAFGHFGQVIDEGKDLDVSEVVHLIQEVAKKVKEVEKA
jgi:hypothetical protein